ncbi:hypothetical protein IT570_01790 [Candidatus Sumerlaeota bacterium]|nr:hypothetical protein [Candidatus Sumerlaeota bacterium]
MPGFIERIFQRRNVEKLLKEGSPRRICIHSVRFPEEKEEGPVRIAFEFLDPPGPWSMQFYEVRDGQEELLGSLSPGTKAQFFESGDGARTRVLRTAENRIVWPR